MQAIDIQSPQLQPVIHRTGLVPTPHRPQEMGKFAVPPHPARKMHESRALAPGAMPADETVQFGCVRPVAFDRQNAESVFFDETMGNSRARPIKFGRSMRRLAEQHDFGVGETIEMRGESLGRMQIRQNL